MNCSFFLHLLSYSCDERPLARAIGYSSNPALWWDPIRHRFECLLFKSSTGMTPHRWLLDARIGRAKQLLLDGDLPLAEVALETGFSEQSHLTRVFRSLVGTTPAAWQRVNRH